MTTNLDNQLAKRLYKVISNNASAAQTSTPITTGVVVQNDNNLYVAVDDETLVPISETNSNVQVGDKVTLAIDDEQALIVGNISDQNATTSEVAQTNVKVAKAQESADDASKVATNYIDIDENKGIIVGNMQDETLGKNTYIDSNGVSIRDGETTLAKFEDTKLSLGLNASCSEVNLCNNMFRILTSYEGASDITDSTFTVSLCDTQSVPMISLITTEKDGAYTRSVKLGDESQATTIKTLSSDTIFANDFHLEGRGDFVTLGYFYWGGYYGTDFGEKITTTSSFPDRMLGFEVYCIDDDDNLIYTQTKGWGKGEKLNVVSANCSSNGFALKSVCFERTSDNTIEVAKNSDGSLNCGVWKSDGTFSNEAKIKIIGIDERC